MKLSQKEFKLPVSNPCLHFLSENGNRFRTSVEKIAVIFLARGRIAPLSDAMSCPPSKN